MLFSAQAWGVAVETSDVTLYFHQRIDCDDQGSCSDTTESMVVGHEMMKRNVRRAIAIQIFMHKIKN